MFKLTKAQRKDRERIEAWLNGVPFRENSRAKPAVPALSPADVLAQYVPPAIQETGQYFTPPEMAQAAVDWAGIPLHDKDILEPCAGIGHLLAVCPDPARVTCYELEQECATLGQRLWPAADWHWAIPFDVSERLAGRFDVALCNPPFSTMRGMQRGGEPGGPFHPRFIPHGETRPPLTRPANGKALCVMKRLGVNVLEMGSWNRAGKGGVGLFSIIKWVRFAL